MRSVVLVAALVGAFGCGKRINPAWCQQAENQSEAECPAAVADALVQETSCHGPDDCSSDPVNKQCLTDQSANVCVECLGPADCTDPMSPACTDHVCLPCSHDFECGDKKYCEDGQCHNATSAFYSSPSGNAPLGADPATNCLQAAPCSLTDGITTALAYHKVLRLIGDPGGNVTFHVRELINLPTDVRISGVSDPEPSKRIVLDNPNALNLMIKVTGGKVELDYVAIVGAKGTAIACAGGTFVVRRLDIHGLVEAGTNVAFTAGSACVLTLDSSVIVGAKHGALDASGSSDFPFAIHNNVFAEGSGGPAVTLHGNGRFEYNTVITNHGATGTSGVSCSDADGVRLDMNIIANNTLDTPPTQPNPDPKKPPIVQPAPQYQGCNLEHGFSDDSVTLNLQSGSDPFTKYRLTILSPLSVVNVSNVVCSGMADIDFALRPAHARCDMGADECADCQFNDPRNIGYEEQDNTDNHGHGGG